MDKIKTKEYSSIIPFRMMKRQIATQLGIPEEIFYQILKYVYEYEDNKIRNYRITFKSKYKAPVSYAIRQCTMGQLSRSFPVFLKSILYHDDDIELDPNGDGNKHASNDVIYRWYPSDDKYYNGVLFPCGLLC